MMNDYRTRTKNNNHDDDDDYLMMDEDDELAQDNRNWQCKCPTGYIGPTCEISVCDNNPCQYGGTCIPYPGSGYLCLCPFGKHGHYCEHSEYLNGNIFVYEWDSQEEELRDAAGGMQIG